MQLTKLGKRKKDQLNLIVDVDYGEDDALAAGIFFDKWDDSEPAKIITVKIDGVAPYEPGAFYKRELPCVLKIFEATKEPIECIIVDSYVWLGPEKPGMGYKLFEALNYKIPVIGVAKKHFHES